MHVTLIKTRVDYWSVF